MPYQTIYAGPMRLALLVIMLAASGCGKAPSAPVPRQAVGADEQAKLNVLFVGNSLTSRNDLPGMLEALIESAGEGPAQVRAFAYPNYGLEDHWRQGKAREAIARGGWDVVVLQQGPSATEGRPSLLEYSKRFAEEIEAAEARIALYMVWPSSRRDFDFDGVCASYRMAAEQVEGMLLPVGEAWRIVQARNADLELYGRDGFHPSPKATYLAALVLFEQLTGRSPVGLPASVETSNGRTFDFPPDEARLLQEAAVEANERFALPRPNERSADE